MKIAGYEILREIGRSAYATVFLATDPAGDRQVALKLMASALALDDDFSRHFCDELNAAAKFSHRNINAIIKAGQADGRFYVVSEYAANGNLLQRMVAGLSAPEVLSIMHQIAKAFAVIHRQSYVHGNIKPSNILIDGQGQAMLADLGMAQALDGNSALSALGLSPAADTYYISPEELRGEELDISSDQYSLGALMYHCLSGQIPYADNDLMNIAWRHCHAPVPVLAPEHASLQPLLERLMAKDRAARFATEQELLAALQEAQAAYAGGRDGSSSPPLGDATRFSRSKRPARRRRRSTARAIAITLFLLLGFGGVIAGSYVWVERETILKDLLNSPLTKRSDSETPARPKHIIGDQALLTPLAPNADADLRTGSENTRTALVVTQGAELASAEQEQEQVQATEVDDGAGLSGDLPKLSLISVSQGLGDAAESVPDEALAAEDMAEDGDSDSPIGAEIELLLREAERQLRILRLTTPPGDNAYETYRKVLALDPYNARARLGTARIVATYVELARKKLDNRRYEESLARINSGLQIAPDHKQLRALKAAVERELVRYRSQAGSQAVEINSIMGSDGKGQRNNGTFSRLLSQPDSRNPTEHR